MAATRAIPQLQPPGRSGARPLVGLLTIALGTSPAALDTSLNIAFPNLTAAFAIALPSLQWVVICYMATYGSLMLVFGKLGDLFGHRRVFRLGLVITGVGLAACGLAADYAFLLVGRALQGVGVAITLSCAPALATSLYPESVRARVLGAFGALFAAFTALGPLIGGMLVDSWGWSAVFFYRVPLVALALAASRLLPEPGAPTRASTFDAASAALLVFLVGAVLLSPASLHWGAGAALLNVAAVLAALFLLIGRERRAADPFLPVAAVHDVTVGALHVSGICVHAASFSILLLVPYYLTEISGLAAGRGGLLLSVAAVGTIAGSFAAGRLATLLGARRTAFLGVVVCAVGLAVIGRWSQGTAALAQAAALALQGVGVGVFQVAYSELVIATLPASDRGVAGSLVVVTRTLGVVAGAAGLSALFQRAQLAALASGLQSSEAFLAAFHSTFAWTWVGLIAGLALTMARPRIFLLER
jgi:MFS family permease